MTDAPIPDSVTPADAEPSIFGPARVTQLLVIAMALVSCAIFRLGASVIHWPSERGFSGSLGQRNSIGALIVSLVLLVLCTLIGTWLLRRRWFLAGLMTATAGLATWSVLGGPMTAVLHYADSAGTRSAVFVQLLAELIIFYGAIAGLWNLIWKRHHTSEIAEAQAQEQGRSAGAAVVAQTALFAMFALILAYTPQKKQILAGIFVAGLASTGIAEAYFADRKAGRWYWIAPLVVGSVGYLLSCFSHEGIETGDLTTSFGALARVLPLDYASLGCAGVLLGYWWMSPEEEEIEEDAVVDKAVSPAQCDPRSQYIRASGLIVQATIFRSIKWKRCPVARFEKRGRVLVSAFQPWRLPKKRVEITFAQAMCRGENDCRLTVATRR